MITQPERQRTPPISKKPFLNSRHPNNIRERFRVFRKVSETLKKMRVASQHPKRSKNASEPSEFFEQLRTHENTSKYLKTPLNVIEPPEPSAKCQNRSKSMRTCQNGSQYLRTSQKVQQCGRTLRIHSDKLRTNENVSECLRTPQKVKERHRTLRNLSKSTRMPQITQEQQRMLVNVP